MAEEAEAPRGAGSGDLNSSGVRPGRFRTAQQPPSCPRRDWLQGCDSFCLPRWQQQPLQTEEWRPRQQHPKPGGTTERSGRRLEQEGRVAAPALHRWPCPERRVRVSNNGAKRRRESRVRPAVVEEVAPRREGWAGRRPPPLARWSLPARRASSAPSPGSPPGHRRQLDPESMVPAPGLI